ncbi:MAG: phospholipase D-like domain-containing protein, partial [bacterium]|nr:phospholipase D-like domain-containing protein [bacterium]
MKLKSYQLTVSFWCLFFICIFYLGKSQWPISLTKQLDALWSQIDVSLPKNFGKTHFIIGQKDQEREQQVAQRLPHISEPEVYFTPDDDVRSVLLDMIAREPQHISIAVFAFTDSKIAQALIDAHTRGVHVELVSDPASLRDVHNKIGMLCDAGLPVYIYNARYARQRGFSSAMHNKFVLFGIGDTTSHVWTGSCNFTRSAYESNQENAVILSDESLAEKFTKQFDRLKQ